MDRDKLRAAVEAGIISVDQARKMEAQLASPGDGEGENESLRFLSNLNDIFLSIGLVILFIGLFAGASIMSFGAVSYKLLTPIICLPLAAIAWMMAEYFTARRKMLLPSIVLAIAFVLFIMTAVTAFYAWTQIDHTVTENLRGGFAGVSGPGDAMREAFDETKVSGLIGSLSAFLAALIFYLRFRLPFTMFLMAGAVTLAAFILSFGYVTLLVAGVLTLCAAIFFDAQDPERRTRVSDNGFWLHVAAAPQLVYGLKGVLELGNDTASSLTMIAIMVGIAVLSLLLNRRALILSGLFSFGFAVFSLFQAFGGSTLMKFAGPLVFLGVLIVLLGGGWRTARGFLLQFFPSTGIWSRIFPAEPRLNV
jgi:hypothetical protein